MLYLNESVTASMQQEIEESAKHLKKAMKGLGTDENAIIKEIVNNSNEKRQLIKAKYLAMYGKTLEEEIKSEISGHFLTGVLALLKPTAEYEAECARNAMKGLGTDENCLIQILCPKEGHEILLLQESYKLRIIFSLNSA